MASPYDSRYASIRDKIIYYANRYNIPSNVGIWQIWFESSFNPTVCSYANACGIAQFIPATAARYNVNRNDIDSSLDGWARYMRDMINMFNGRVDIALAGYNSGENRSEYRAAARENRAINWNVLPSGVQSQTKPYVNKIMQAAGNVAPTVSTTPINFGGLTLNSIGSGLFKDAANNDCYTYEDGIYVYDGDCPANVTGEEDSTLWIIGGLLVLALLL